MSAGEAGYVYPTDREWSAFLRARPHLTEVNFWTPSGAGFSRLNPGDRFLFKAKAREGGKLIGGGLFSSFVRAPVSIAWRAFGEGNGVASESELLRAVNRYRDKQGLERKVDPEIGCIVLNDAFFVPNDEGVDPPPDFKAAGAARGKGYGHLDITWPHIEASFADLALRAGVAPIIVDPEMASAIDGPVLSESRATWRRHRLGQGAFRVLVADSYQKRCAITGSRVTLTLDAAHIRPVANEGQNRLDNGLLLRTDVHRLFDAGYLGVDLQHRLRVSPKLRTDFGNGQEFYDRAGSELAVLPIRAADRPNHEFIEWHNDEIFLSA